MTDEQINALEELINREGWKIYIALLKDRFDREYRKLRNSKKSDTTYARICGFLDGLEIAESLIGNEIEEHKRAKEL